MFCDANSIYTFLIHTLRAYRNDALYVSNVGILVKILYDKKTACFHTKLRVHRAMSDDAPTYYNIDADTFFGDHKSQINARFSDAFGLQKASFIDRIHSVGS